MRTTLISAIAVAMVCGWRASAQTSASVKGVVTDSSGALVPGAEIVVTNLDTGARRQTLSNESGVYDVPLLQPGHHNVAAHKPGFKHAVRDGLVLELNQIAQIDFTLVAGELTETVEVQATAAPSRVEHLVGRTGDLYQGSERSPAERPQLHATGDSRPRGHRRWLLGIGHDRERNQA